MQEIIKLGLGIIALLIGMPIGSFLARLTNDEQREGQKWFKFIALVSLIIGFVGLVMGNDVILFTFFFIAIVTSKSIKKN
jgi:hypothetical protein